MYHRPAHLLLHIVRLQAFAHGAGVVHAIVQVVPCEQRTGDSRIPYPGVPKVAFRLLNESGRLPLTGVGAFPAGALLPPILLSAQVQHIVQLASGQTLQVLLHPASWVVPCSGTR